MSERDDYADNDLPRPWRPALNDPRIATIITAATIAVLALLMIAVWAMEEFSKTCNG